MRFGFKFSWLPFLATVAAVALGVALGQWQNGRAMQKEALENRLLLRQSKEPIQLGRDLVSADDAEFRRVVVSGEFIREWPLYLENRPYQGRAGFYVLMPFKIANSDVCVLVARGWIARNVADRTIVPSYDTPAGKIGIEGLAKKNPGRLMQLGDPQIIRPNAILQNIEVAEFVKASKFKAQPIIIEQAQRTEPAPDNLIRDWPRPSSGIEKHRGYAFQWYGLATMAFLFFLITGFRSGTKSASK